MLRMHHQRNASTVVHGAASYRSTAVIHKNRNHEVNLHSFMNTMHDRHTSVLCSSNMMISKQQQHNFSFSHATHTTHSNHNKKGIFSYHRFPHPSGHFPIVGNTDIQFRAISTTANQTSSHPLNDENQQQQTVLSTTTTTGVHKKVTKAHHHHHHKKKVHHHHHHQPHRTPHHHHHHHHHHPLHTHQLLFRQMNDHFLSVNERAILASRDGRVLNMNTLLKVDQSFDQTFVKHLLSNSTPTSHQSTSSPSSSNANTTAAKHEQQQSQQQQPFMDVDISFFHPPPSPLSASSSTSTLAETASSTTPVELSFNFHNHQQMLLNHHMGLLGTNNNNNNNSNTNTNTNNMNHNLHHVIGMDPSLANHTSERSPPPNHVTMHHDLRFMRLGGADNFRAATMPTGINPEMMTRSADDNDDMMNDDSTDVAAADAVMRAMMNEDTTDPSLLSRIFGVAQPTVSGIRAVLNVLNGKRKSIVWINLREEPVIYINSRPHVLREIDHPFQNMSYYSGISVDRIEEMEEALKLDVIRESQRYSDNILIHDEIVGTGPYYRNQPAPAQSPNQSHQAARHKKLHHVSSGSTGAPETNDDRIGGLVSGAWESITPDSLLTPKDVYSNLAREGYKVRYVRLPITAETDLSYHDIDQLISCLRTVDHDSFIVFNCQLGKTRSTHAMTIAWLMDILRDKERLSKAEQLAQQRSFNLWKTQKSLKRFYHTGMYQPVTELLRVLQYGSLSKDLSDLAIDNCGTIRNLRASINKFRTKAEKSRNKETRDLFTKIAFKYLSRYYHIIIVADYLRANLSLEMNSLEHTWITFDEYMRQRSEQQSILTQYHHNPEGALLKTKDELQLSLDDVDLVYHRAGKVLSAMTILKRDHFFEPMAEFQESFLRGAPNFRGIVLCNVPIFASATPSVEGFKNILNIALRNQQPLHIINLREECLCYINGSPYNLRDIAHPFVNLNLTGIQATQLQAIEETLKTDCLNEMKDSKLLLHDETNNMELVAFWEKCDPNSIQTPSEAVGSLTDLIDVHYHHIPLTPLNCPMFVDLDNFVSVLCSVREKGGNILFFDQFGVGRSFVAHVASALFIHTCKLYSGNNEVVDCFKPVDPYNNPTLVYNASFDILRLLPDSLKRVAEVNYAIELCQMGVGTLDFRNDIEMEILSAQTARTSTASSIHMQKAGQLLKKYLLMVVFSSYLHDQTKRQFAVKFSDWISNLPEIVQVLNMLDTDPVSSLKKIKSAINQEKPSETRLGEVLAKRTLLKRDHFPGCQRKQLLPHIEGAPNFRQISEQYGNIYGVAIPTKTGIGNVLNLLKAQQNRVVWINLREEPLIYINNEPYCLRDNDRPFENIIQTGINAERLELMEERLKYDVINEAKSTNNRILSHDEGDDFQAFPQYIPVDSDSIMTVRDVYSSMSQEGYMIDFHRIPITDERAPLAEDFDAVIQVAVGVDPHTTHFVANCQMGRGRTTTCMVVLALVNSWRRNAHNLTMNLTQSHSSPPSPIPLSGASAINLRNGNYSVIVKLLRVLKHGSRNKAQVDKVIDDCSQMQNLRTAIYDRKLLSIPEPNQPITQKHEFIRQRAIDYLERYALLIIFNEYLHEEFSQYHRKPFSLTFKDWLASRGELTNILRSQMKLE